MMAKSAKIGERGQVTIPQVVLDKNSFDAVLKRRIEEAEVAVKEGRVLGPFDDARAALRAVRKRAHARRAD